jgi:hypothetical protein
MKKLILCFTMAAIVTASIATGCSSEKAATGGDTTAVGGAVPASGDTTKMDTMKKDTTHH